MACRLKGEDTSKKTGVIIFGEDIIIGAVAYFQRLRFYSLDGLAFER